MNISVVQSVWNSVVQNVPEGTISSSLNKVLCYIGVNKASLEDRTPLVTF